MGVSVFAANLATLRPLVRHVKEGSSRDAQSEQSHPRPTAAFEFQQVGSEQLDAHRDDVKDQDQIVIDCRDVEAEAGSTISLTRSTRDQ